MLKVVVDTNVFVSGLISKKGAPFELLNLWKDSRFVFLTAKALISELQETLGEPRFLKKYLTIAQDLADLTTLFEMDTVVVEIQSNVRGAIPADPDDEIFLAAAVDGHADVIVSGDAHLLEMESFRGIPIVTPREFLELIKI